MQVINHLNLHKYCWLITTMPRYCVLPLSDALGQAAVLRTV